MYIVRESMFFKGKVDSIEGIGSTSARTYLLQFIVFGFKYVCKDSISCKVFSTVYLSMTRYKMAEELFGKGNV